jgi:hypothetical protein
MTPSPELIHELRATRPSAPAELRARVRAVASERPGRAPWASWRLPARRGLLVAVPAAAALAIASAGVLGVARSDSPQTVSQGALEKSTLQTASPEYDTSTAGDGARSQTQPAPLTTGDRAQRVSATLTVEVNDANAVSHAAQSALDLTRSLGGYIVTSSVATGEDGSASITVRVPVDKVQDAIGAGLASMRVR